MGIVIGGEFQDYGNTPEFSISEVRAYERLSGDRIRLYVTEERGECHVLQYTVIAPMSAFAGVMRMCSKVTGDRYVLPGWAMGVKTIDSAH